MKQLILIAILATGSFSALAEVKEFSPVKVIVDTEKGIVLREPTELDYNFVLVNAGTKDVNKSFLEKVFGKKNCHKKG